MMRRLLYGIMIVSWVSASAQQIVTPMTRDLIPPTPEARAVQKVQMPEPALLTGAADMAIPLYSVPLGDMTIPLTLRYHSNGIKVSDDPAPVGYGWTLQPALRATRTVMGRPDEQYPFMSGLEDDTRYKCFECVMSPNIQAVNYSPHDSEHDIFTFSLPDVTIVRILDCTGDKPQFLGGFDREYTVEATANLDTIDVYSPLGVRYSFYGLCEYQPVDYAGPGTVRTAWPMSRITAPSGQSVHINWEPIPITRSPQILAGVSFFDSWDPIRWDGSNIGMMELTYDNSETANFSAYPGCPYVLTPSSLVFDGGRVEMGYSKHQEGKFLKKIEIRDGQDATVKTVTLDHDIFNCLTSVRLSDAGDYAFRYIQRPQTSFRQHAQDWWGYYNGKLNPSLTPKVKIRRYKEHTNAGQMLEYGDADRSVDTVAIQDRMLTHVVYPTGGTADFEYEVHRFPPMRSGGGTSHDLADETNPWLDRGGGLRVKSITMSEGGDAAEPLRVEYRYDSVQVRAVPSMATFISITRAMLPLKGFLTWQYDMGELRSVVISGESNYMRYDMGQTPIWYGKVTAIYPEGKIEYTHADAIQQNQIYTDYGVRAHLGLTKVFDSGINLVEKTIYQGTAGTYSPVQTDRWNYKASYGLSVGSTMIQRLIIQASSNWECPDFRDAEYMGPLNNASEKVDGQIYQPWCYGVVPTVARLVGKSSTMFTATGEFTTSEKYSYIEGTGLLKSIVRTASDGNSETLTTVYAYEGTDSLSLAMTAAHCPGLPMSESQSRGTASTLLRAIYSRPADNLFKISRTAISQGNGPELLSSSISYGANGRPVTITDADGIASCFDWSADGMYLISHTEGLPTAVLLEDDGRSRISAGDINPDAIDGITTTYAYKKLVGVSEIKYPWGSTGTYTYDAANRLAEITTGGTTIAEFAYSLGHDRNNAVVSSLHLRDGSVHRTESRYDGLGREVDQHDISTGLTVTTRYDGMGRPAAVSVPGASEPDEYGWNTVQYELSPRAVELNRVKAGRQWQQQGRGVVTSIFANTSSGIYSCSNYLANSSGTLTHRGNYGPGRLLVKETVDEEGYTIREFTDMAGRVLKTSTGRGTDFGSTHYIYDDYGRLRAVLPPNVAGAVPQPYEQEFRDKVFEYRYDSHGRLSSASTPGAGTTSYRYTTAGRLMARRTPAMTAGQWEVFTYDRAGRMAVNFLATTSTAELDSLAGSFRPVEFSGTGSLAGYSAGRCKLPAARDVLKANYYDNYKFLSLYSPDLTAPGTVSAPRGLMTGSVDFAGGTVANIMGYDWLGRECTRITLWPDATERTERTFDLQGNEVEETNSYVTSLGRTINRTTVKDYDSAGRLVRSSVTEGMGTLTMEYSYGSDGRLATLDYPGGVKARFAYDCHGWLTSHTVTKPISPVVPETPSLPLASQYYTSLSGFATASTPEIAIRTLLDEAVYYQDGRQPLFNGCPSGYSIAPSGRYDFTFDDRNRLVAADYIPAASESSDADFSAEYSYDAIANPLKVKRYGVVGVDAEGNETFGLLDGLNYSYGSGSKVSKIKRTGEGVDFYGRSGFPCVETAQFSWNKAGALTSDPARGIENISYGPRGLTDTIAYSDGTLQIWRHTSDSVLIGVRTIEPGGRFKRASERQYRGRRIFVDYGLEYSAFEGGYFDASGAPHFYHTDYRGNIVMVTDSAGEVVQRTSYYPYGEPHRLPQGQPYLFASKERHPRTGATLFGPRNLLTSALFWSAPDALSGLNRDNSSWSFCAGNPICFTDPSGKKLEIAKALSHPVATEILQNLQELSDDVLFIKTGQNGKRTVSYKPKGGSNFHKKVGTNLIREIIDHKSSVIIDKGNTQRSKVETILQSVSFAASPSQVADNIAQKGVKSVVNFNYNQRGRVLVYDQNHTVYKSTPSPIILGHELIHALHYLNGTAVDPSIEVINTFTGSLIKVEELFTIGLRGNSPMTENNLRIENGLPIRLDH